MNKLNYIEGGKKIQKEVRFKCLIQEESDPLNYMQFISFSLNVKAIITQLYSSTFICTWINYKTYLKVWFICRNHLSKFIYYKYPLTFYFYFTGSPLNKYNL